MQQASAGLFDVPKVCARSRGISCASGQFISFYSDSLFNPHSGEIITFRPDNTLAITMVFQGLDKQQADNVWHPFFKWVASSPRDFTNRSGTYHRERACPELLGPRIPDEESS